MCKLCHCHWASAPKAMSDINSNLSLSNDQSMPAEHQSAKTKREPGQNQ